MLSDSQCKVNYPAEPLLGFRRRAAGPVSPFALVPEIRRIFEGTLALADKLVPHGEMNMENEAQAWKTIWAGHGVGAIGECPATAGLCAKLIFDYQHRKL